MQFKELFCQDWFRKQGRFNLTPLTLSTFTIAALIYQKESVYSLRQSKDSESKYTKLLRQIFKIHVTLDFKTNCSLERDTIKYKLL